MFCHFAVVEDVILRCLRDRNPQGSIGSGRRDFCNFDVIMRGYCFIFKFQRNQQVNWTSNQPT
ncbi:hypothetical protein NECAME_14916 [Necator americanus]|uniref:Uncharacterized protein n=1 Tax=Necator americanus TaxID=51031 RepID=W2SKK9_NECAM|nr:hypothetical protein NECAME_14916 [Necator americanus]ETN70214.1 hypothetical protein NECAME_14916 [Necator americanus]